MKKETPFIAVGNDELGDKVGEKAECPNCGKYHKVTHGKERRDNGEWIESKLLSFVKCGKISYLVAIKGRSFDLDV